ncbi:hypothetical protein [Chryseobacterium nematophagum]|nr:hypothetical protein [Chryseobacterium nematophagum]
MSSHREKVKILVALSDKLWEDYIDESISEEDYLEKMYLVKREINNGFINKMQELEFFISDLGYLVLKNPIISFVGGSEKIILSKN